MEIRINGKLAALKKGTSFEYVAENRLFSGSDGYTLSITFPLRHCKQNLEIFGHINRQDVIAGKCIFDCEIRDRSFYKFGSITITEINDAEVKTQFLEGRSEQNFDKTFDKVYINELDLGSHAGVVSSAIEPWQAWDPIVQGMEAVALPWWNDSSEGLPHNFALYDAASGKFVWDESTTSLTWMPYLIFITRRICEAIGYEYDFSAWTERDEYKFMLICNVLPGAWDANGYARALPHWNVDEFFAKLELFLGGEFTIDHRARRISFSFTQDVLGDTAPILLDRIVDEHSVEVSVEDDRCEYLEAKNLVYKECDHPMWKYYSCDWYIKAQMRPKEYDTLAELLAAQRHYADWDGTNGRGDTLDCLFYAKDVDTHFIIRSVDRYINPEWNGRKWRKFRYICRLQPINMFGGRIMDDSEDADELEIEFVPVRIDHTEDKFGRVAFLNFSGYNESSPAGYRAGWETDDEAWRQSNSDSWLSAGEKEKKAEYYDRIYVAYWDGAMENGATVQPHPYIEDIEIRDDWSGYIQHRFSLRINSRLGRSATRITHNIDPKKKTTFKFLSDTIPDPRAVYHIKGQRYLCERITATFTESGCSTLKKGTFYPIVE